MPLNLAVSAGTDGQVRERGLLVAVHAIPLSIVHATM
jgi:hypothetical protein